MAQQKERSLKVDQWLDPLLEIANGANIPMDFGMILPFLSQKKTQQVVETYRDEILEQLALDRSISFARDPTNAASIIESFPDSVGKDKAIANLASRWAETDPAAAAQWSESLSDTPGKTMAYRSIANEWGQHDLDRTLNWITNQDPSATRDAATQEAVKIIARKDSLGALEVAQSIGGESVRSSTVADVLKTWGGYDFDKAVREIASMELPEDVRSEVSKAIEEEKQWRKLAPTRP
jgi:hypothetical protein